MTSDGDNLALSIPCVTSAGLDGFTGGGGETSLVSPPPMAASEASGYALQ